MFATARALNPEDGVKGNFAARREEILKTAKVLVEDTKHLVSSAGGSQEQLPIPMSQHYIHCSLL